MDIQKNVKQKIEECIQEISDLCHGSNTVSDAILDFDDDKYKIYEKQKEKLIKCICNMVKTNLEIPDFEQFYEQLPDVKFWNSTREIVEKRTKNYLNAVSYNSMETAKRMALLEKCFELVFGERENGDFIAEQFEDVKMARTVYGIMMESEYAIVTFYVSKRRFIIGMGESYGLVADDAEYIWNLFNSNFDMVERHEFHRRMILFSRKLDELTDTVDELQEEFDTLISIFEENG